jgi:hypothetical protein
MHPAKVHSAFCFTISGSFGNKNANSLLCVVATFPLRIAKRGTVAAFPTSKGRVTATPRVTQSSGSTLTMEAPWLLPVQNVTGVVVSST